MNSDQGFTAAIAIPILFAILVAIYAYFDFASNGITSPRIFFSTLLVAFYSFVLAYLICMTVFIWSDT